MNPHQRRQWYGRALLVGVAILAALSMHMERMVGWRFIALCFFIGSIGGFGVLYAKSHLRLGWTQFSQRQRITLISTALVLVIGGSFVVNYGEPEGSYNNFVTCVGALSALLLWAFYRLVARVLDAVWVHFSSRR